MWFPKTHSESSAAPDVPRRTGHGLLPAIIADDSARPVLPAESRYSLQQLAKGADADVTAARRLTLRSAATGERLPSRVSELERLRKRLLYVEGSIAHHRFLQGAAFTSRDHFPAKNVLVARAHELQVLDQTGRRDDAGPRREALAAVVAPFARVCSSG